MDFDSLLGQLETTRPDLSESLSLIRQYQQEKKEKPANDTEDHHTQEWQSLAGKQRKINQTLLRRYQELENNYKLLLRQLDVFAEAVGACPECWGEDIECNFCRGHGKPGHLTPNPEYFDLYIRPAINKLKNSKPQTFNN